MSLTCLKTGEARENEIYGFSYTFHLLQLNFESVAGGRHAGVAEGVEYWGC